MPKSHGWMVQDILVETSNPELLDKTLNALGAALVGGGMPGGFIQIDGVYLVRCFGDAGFIEFAIENQGYGKVIKAYPGTYDQEAMEKAFVELIEGKSKDVQEESNVEDKD